MALNRNSEKPRFYTAFRTDKPKPTVRFMTRTVTMYALCKRSPGEYHDQCSIFLEIK